MSILIALAQMEVVPGRPDLNFQTMSAFITQAKQTGVQLLIFPEMAIPGYLLGDLWEQAAFIRDCAAYGDEIVKASDELCIVFGNIAMDKQHINTDGRIRKYNACFIAQHGRLVSNRVTHYPYQIKTLLPNYREFEDSRHFTSLQQVAAENKLSLADCLRPVRLQFNQETIELGCLICEDGWSDDYAISPAALFKANGATLLINISSSPFTLGKNNKRNRIFSAHACENKLPLLYVNAIGLQNNGKTLYVFDGNSTAYQSDGTVIASTVAYQEALLTYHFYPESNQLSLVSPPCESDNASETKTIYRTLSFGAERFLRQTGINRLVVGLSGGIDSAVVAALTAPLVGADNLLLINMPSRHNSPLTQQLAGELAKNLNAPYAVVPIDTSFEHTLQQLVSTSVQAKNGSYHLPVPSGLTQENIQARDRSARILAAFASSFGGAFTCNANKSELSVGYSTFYGDLGGCFAILGDLWKWQVYALGRYLNENIYSEPVIPESIFTIRPSAELSPQQTVGVGGDPLHYPYHDYLFQAFIERWDKAAPEDIARWYQEGVLEEKLGCENGLTAALFATPQAFFEDLERWWRLFAGFAIAKRIQAPPVMAVSRRAYGFDHREAQLSPYFSRSYWQIKKTMTRC